MDRESGWFQFPPSEEGLNQPSSAISQAAKHMTRALSSLSDFQRECANFPSVGDERRKSSLMRQMDRLRTEYQRIRDQVSSLVRQTDMVKDDVAGAFHDPLSELSEMRGMEVTARSHRRVPVGDPRWRK